MGRHVGSTKDGGLQTDAIQEGTEVLICGWCGTTIVAASLGAS